MGFAPAGFSRSLPTSPKVTTRIEAELVRNKKANNKTKATNHKPKRDHRYNRDNP